MYAINIKSTYNVAGQCASVFIDFTIFYMNQTHRISLRMNTNPKNVVFRLELCYYFENEAIITFVVCSFSKFAQFTENNNHDERIFKRPSLYGDFKRKKKSRFYRRFP